MIDMPKNQPTQTFIQELFVLHITMTNKQYNYFTASIHKYIFSTDKIIILTV